MSADIAEVDIAADGEGRFGDRLALFVPQTFADNDDYAAFFVDEGFDVPEEGFFREGALGKVDEVGAYPAVVGEGGGCRYPAGVAARASMITTWIGRPCTSAASSCTLAAI